MAPKLSSLDRETSGLKVFPVMTLIGWILIGISILVSIIVLAPTAGNYWGGSAKSVRDAGEVGSVLVGQLGLITSTIPWLNALRFLGMALLFTGITVALAVIIRTLQFQERTLDKFLKVASGNQT